MKRRKVVSIALALVLTLSLATGFATKASATSTAKKPAVLTIISEMRANWVKNFNPYINNSLQATQGFMYEPLTVFNGYQNNKEVPWLASKIDSLADNKTLIIHVRKGVKWSDGVPFTAKDVAFTYNYLKAHPTIDRSGLWAKGKLASVTATDANTVKLVIQQPNRFARTTYVYQIWMVPEHIFSKIKNPDNYVLAKPVATGPFTQVKTVSNVMMVIDRNPNYWQASKLAVDEMRWPQVNSNQAAIALMKSGAVDWAHIFVADAEKNYVAGNKNNKFWYGKNDATKLTINYQDPNPDTLKAFNSVDFRRAMSLASDRNGIIDSAVYGYISKDVPTNTGLCPALNGYSDKTAQAEMAKYTKFNVAEAKQILDKAGFKDVNGDGFVENPDGTPIKFTIQSPAGWTDWNQGASICAQGMQAAGINATATAVDLSIYTDAWANNNHDVQYSGTGLYTDPYQFYYTTIGNASAIKTVSWWSTNLTNYKNDKINAEIAKMPTAKSDAEVKKIASDVEKYFAQNMINIPLYFNGNWVNYSTARFTGWATAANPFCNPANVSHDSKLLQLLALKAVK